MKFKDTMKTHLSQLFKHRKPMSSDSNQENMDIYEDRDIQVENDKVDDEDDKEDGEDDKTEEENEEEAGEKEDVADEEADERYWKAKAKEGVHRVCLSVISENN